MGTGLPPTSGHISSSTRTSVSKHYIWRMAQEICLWGCGKGEGKISLGPPEGRERSWRVFPFTEGSSDQRHKGQMPRAQPCQRHSLSTSSWARERGSGGGGSPVQWVSLQQDHRPLRPPALFLQLREKGGGAGPGGWLPKTPGVGGGTSSQLALCPRGSSSAEGGQYQDSNHLLPKQSPGPGVSHPESQDPPSWQD